MNSINNRIFEVIEFLGVTKTSVANRLNVTQQYISKIVKTGNPSELFVDSFCSKYNINEHWLRTGEGEMFLPTLVEDEYFKAATSLSKDNDKLAMQLVIDYWKLNEENKKLAKEYILKLANIVMNEKKE